MLSEQQRQKQQVAAIERDTPGVAERPIQVSKVDGTRAIEVRSNDLVIPIARDIHLIEGFDLSMGFLFPE